MKRQGQDVVPVTDVLRGWVMAEYRDGVTQAALAARCGVSDRVLRTIVKGTPRVNGRGYVSRGDCILLESADRIATGTGHHLSEIDLG